jgi:hypothetical protein
LIIDNGEWMIDDGLFGVLFFGGFYDGN